MLSIAAAVFGPGNRPDDSARNGARRPSMAVAADARGAGAVAIVDRPGNVPAGVPALMVCAGRRDDELARPLLDADVRNIPPLEHLDKHPRRHVAHELAARRARALVVLEQPALELIALARRHDDP